jgi:hypothetical protein
MSPFSFKPSRKTEREGSFALSPKVAKAAGLVNSADKIAYKPPCPGRCALSAATSLLRRKLRRIKNLKIVTNITETEYMKE